MRFWDSSAIVPLLCSEEASPAIQRLYWQDSDLLVWVLTRTEILSALCRRLREMSMTREDPNNATALSNLGYFLTERNERLDEALDLIKRAVLLDPSNGSFLDSLGWLYFKLGKVDDARKYIEQAIIYQPRSAAIRDHLGDIYKKVGRDADAVAQWKKALALGHDPDELSNIKAKLESASAKND